MARLRADKKNYKKAFNTHFEAYKSWKEGCYNSKRVIICYCVECGLKCLIMEDKKIYRLSQADQETAKALGSHDFRVLLKAVKKVGMYKFKDFYTEFDEIVTTDSYHQFCRYSIEVKDKDIKPLEEFDATLETIAEWLKEVI